MLLESYFQLAGSGSFPQPGDCCQSDLYATLVFTGFARISEMLGRFFTPTSKMVGVAQLVQEVNLDRFN